MPAQIGFVLPALEDPPTGEKPTWDEIQQLSQRAEDIGLDTLWVPDELYWKIKAWPAPRGFWECVALTSAVAASTSTIKVGTWVLSALHRNPGLTAKVAATLDEISGGRFIFGLGSGHWRVQGKAFGLPEGFTVSRYEEALQIIVPLVRGEEVTFEGEYHSAHELVNAPSGPSGSSMPIMLAGHGPRNVGLAVEHGDIWSAYATDSSLPDAFAERLSLVAESCEKAGRDPATLTKSLGVVVEHPGAGVKSEDVGLGVPIRGDAEDVASVFGELEAAGADMIEVTPFPDAQAGLEFLADVVALYRAD